MTCCNPLTGIGPPSGPPLVGNMPFYVDLNTRCLWFWDGLRWGQTSNCGVPTEPTVELKNCATGEVYGKIWGPNENRPADATFALTDCTTGTVFGFGYAFAAPEHNVQIGDCTSGNFFFAFNP